MTDDEIRENATNMYKLAAKDVIEAETKLKEIEQSDIFIKYTNASQELKRCLQNKANIEVHAGNIGIDIQILRNTPL